VTPEWRTIERENRGLSIGSVRIIGEGWTSCAWLVNDELVFRFPKRADDWVTLHREIAFLAVTADHLPLAVPRYVHVAPESAAAAHGYAIYRYVPGQAMDVSVMSPDQRAAAADVIAAFLQSLHDFKPTVEVAALLPREDARLVVEEYFALTEREIAPRLDPLESDRLVRELETYHGVPANFSFRPVVLHADFSAEHILMENMAVSGAIDFEDVNWGDPDYDFMYLFLDFGQTFVEDVARRYGHPDLDRLATNVRHFAVLDQIDTILEDTGRALEGQKDAAWRRLRQLLEKPRS
jgi:aminoglycoside 2''-phosphotransferase